MTPTTQKFNLLSGIAKTKFISFPVPATPNGGIPIGQGKCRAVILRLNFYTRNDTATPQTVLAVYYGDDQRQEFELITGTNSEIIFCEDLEQVFIRTATACTVQALIYY